MIAQHRANGFAVCEIRLTNELKPVRDINCNQMCVPLPGENGGIVDAPSICLLLICNERSRAAFEDRAGILQPPYAGDATGVGGKQARRLDFRPHRAGGEGRCIDPVRPDMPDRLLRRRAPAFIDRVDVRQHQERVGAELFGEQPCGAVLVDDGLDALELAVAVADDRDATAAGADDDHAEIDQ